MDLDASPAINFWKDPTAEPCCICGEEDEEEEGAAAAGHTELTCPYNYLAPGPAAAAASSYVPCRARAAAWSEGRGALSEHRWFLRRFVRATNLPGSCRPADLAALFAAFGALRMWHVAMDGPGKCKGLACVVFDRREDAEVAIEELNCYSFAGRSLRVDWAYPSA